MTEPSAGQLAKPVSRPLSPHLQVYRPMLSMTMSIMHRLTGLVLYAGAGAMVVWLLAAALSESCFAIINGWAACWLGQIGLVLLSWALTHHALGGIRHFIWDTGRGFALPQVEWLVRANLIGSILLTVLLWAIMLAVRS